MLTQFRSEEIDGIFLPSSALWLKAISTVPNIPVEADHSWWLCEKGFMKSDIACYVEQDGMVNETDGHVCDLRGVRPCFRIAPNRTVIPSEGEKIKIGNITCTVIRHIHAYKTYCDALSDVIIGQAHFDTVSNDYMKSDIYKYLHSDSFMVLCNSGGNE